MKLSIVFVSFTLFLLCAVTVTSKAHTIALEKDSALLPYERSLTHRIKRELDSLHDELAFPRTRVARQAPTDPEVGNGGKGGLWNTFVRTVLLLPRALLRTAITIVDVIGRLVCGFANGISATLTKFLGWLSTF